MTDSVKLKPKRTGTKFVLALAFIWFAVYDLYLILTVVALEGVYVQPFRDVATLLWTVVPPDLHAVVLLIPGIILWSFWAGLRRRSRKATPPVPAPVLVSRLSEQAQQKRRCPNCKGFLKQTAIFCPRCLAQLPVFGQIVPSLTSPASDVIDDMLAAYPSTEKVVNENVTASAVPAAPLQPSPITTKAKPNAEPENGYLPEDYVDYIVRRSDWFRSRMRIAAKAFAALFLLAVSWFVLSNVNQLFALGVAVLFWSTVFLQLNQRYPILMSMLYTVVLLVIGLVYALPYRMVRKELRLVYGKDTKTIGRILAIKGADYGESPGGFRYVVWYAVQILKHRILHAVKKTKVEWEQFRPSPHEYPFGDAYYLLGNPKRAIPQFRYIVYYRSNALGIVRRFFHAKVLYTNAKLDTTMFVCRLVGDGVNILEVPRVVKGGIPHQELSPLPLMYHYRPRQPYIDMVDGGLERQAGLVDRGVRSDAELAKEGVREFTAPAPSVVYRGLSTGEVEGPRRKPKKPTKPGPEVDEEGPASLPEESESYGKPSEEDDSYQTMPESEEREQEDKEREQEGS